MTLPNLLVRGNTARPLALLVLLNSATVGSLARAPETAMRAAEPAAPIHSLVTADDYPEDAQKKGEQGTAEFLLTVGVDGQPTDCVITNSSGSSSLDSASCLIMMERARFQPALNEQGNPVVGNYQNRIVWRLEDSAIPPAIAAAGKLWTACAWGEAAKLAPSELSAAEIYARVVASCAPLEERIAIEMRKPGIEGLDAAKLIPELKKGMEAKLPGELDATRAALKGEVRK